MLASFSGPTNQLQSPRSSSPPITMTSIEAWGGDRLDEILGTPSGVANPVTPESNGNTPKRNRASSALKITPYSAPCGIRSRPSPSKPSSAETPFKSPSLSGGQRSAPTSQEKFRAQQTVDDEKARFIAGALKSLEFNPKTPSPPKIVTGAKRKETVVNPFSLRTTARAESAKARMRLQREEEEKRQAETGRFRARSAPRTTFEYEPISKLQLSSATLKRMEKLREQNKKRAEADQEKSVQFYRPPPESTYKSPKPLTRGEEEALQRLSSLKRKKFELQLEEEKRREMETSPRKSRPPPPTTYSPRHILAEKEQQAMTEAQLSRERKMEEWKKEEELKKRKELGSPRKARPPPPTTYSPRHILAEKEEKAMRDAVLARELKLEDQRKLEDEKRCEEEAKKHKARPAPPTTYNPRHISPEKEEKAIRAAQLVREQKLEEQRKQDEDKLREDSEFKKPRPVPATTYTPNHISPEQVQKALADAALTREIKLEKIHQEEEKKLAEEDQKYKARRIPKTTYNPNPVLPWDADVLQKVEEVGQKRRGHPETEPAISFRARPVPKSLRKPVEVKGVHPIPSPAKKLIVDEPPVEKEKFEFHARPVPKSTFKTPKSPHVKRELPEKKKLTPSPKAPVVVEELKEKVPEFHARPVPKSLYKPKLVPPKRPIKREAPRMPAAAIRDRSVPVGKAREAKFHARPIPRSTYKPSAMKRPVPDVGKPKKDTTPPSVEDGRPDPEATNDPVVLSPKTSKTSTDVEVLIQENEQSKRHPPRTASSENVTPFRARRVPKSTYKPSVVQKNIMKPRVGSAPKGVRAEIVGSGIEKSNNTFSVRADPVAKTLSTVNPTTDFIPISHAKKLSTLRLAKDRSTALRAVLVAKAKPVVSKSSTTTNEVLNVSSSSLPIKLGTLEHSETFVDASTSQGVEVDDYSELAAAILSDDEAPEITFERDEDDGDNTEVAAILDGMGAWAATVEDDEDHDAFDSINH